MVWKIKFDPRAEKELKKLDRLAQKRIINHLKNQIGLTTVIKNLPNFTKT